MSLDATKINVCTGATVEINDVHVGYLDGPITVNSDTELLKFITGVPRLNVKQLVLDDQFKASLKLAQLTNRNLAITALNMPYTEVAGGAGTFTDIVRKFVAVPGRAFEVLHLPNPGTTYALSAVTQNIEESPATYTAEDDYFLDATAGIVYRNPAGDIASGAEVVLTGTYTKRAYSQLALGKRGAVATNKFRLTWLTDDLREWELLLHKAQSAASWELVIGGENFTTIPLVVEATDDSSNNPDTPYGHLREIEPAA